VIRLHKKAKLKLLVILMAGALCTQPAYAAFGGGPQYDPTRWAQSVWDNVNQMTAWVKTEVIDKYQLEARFQAVRDEVDSYNNGFSNWIARIDGSLAELSSLDQQTRARPIQNACSVVGVQRTTDEVDCAEDDIEEMVNSTSESITSYISDFGKKVKSGLGISSVATPFSTGNIALSNEALVQKVQAEIALDKFYRKQGIAVDLNDLWIKFGKKPNDPTLLLLTETQAPVYTDEEMAMAINTADITYPEFLKKSNTDPENERELANDIRVKNAILSNNKVIYDQIAMRTAPSNGMPSKLMAMMMPVQLKLSDDAELETDGESWIHKVALNEGTTPGENTKESLLLKALQVQQALASYKAQLLTESLIVQAYTAKIDAFTR
jgi:hypothetical protein